MNRLNVQPGYYSIHASYFLRFIEPNSRAFLGLLLGLLEVAKVATEDAHYALELPMSDLEDAMQVAAAQKFGASHEICLIIKILRYLD